jgi:antitoxin HicB
MRYGYPANVQQAADGVTVTFPDIPEAISCGATSTEALERAADALISALATDVEDDRATPLPSALRGRPVIGVTALEATKLALHDAMLAAGVSNVELAHRLGLDEKVVHRLRDPLRRSDIGTLETALRTLGKRVEITVRDAA